MKFYHFIGLPNLRKRKGDDENCFNLKINTETSFHSIHKGIIRYLATYLQFHGNILPKGNTNYDACSMYS